MNTPVYRLDQGPGYGMRRGGEEERVLDMPQFETRLAGLGGLFYRMYSSALCPTVWRQTSAGRLQATESFRIVCRE